MIKFNPQFPNLDKKSWLALLILALLIISIPVGLFLSQQTQIFKPRAQESGNLTKQLLEAKKIYDNPSQGVNIFSSGNPKEQALAEMISISLKRKEELLKLAEQNPKQFLEQANLYSIRENFPEQAKQNIEKQVEVEGEIRVFHIDYKDPSKNKHAYKLQAGNLNYQLHFSGYNPNILSKTKVSVKGIVIDHSIVLKPENLIKRSQVSTQAIPEYPGAKGEQKTAVILANFQNDTSKPISKEEVQTNLFNNQPGSQSVNNYYKENSYDQTNFSGEVFGWITIPLTNQGCMEFDYDTFTSGYDNWSDAAIGASGVNFGNFDRIVFVFPAENVCEGVLGVGEVGRLNTFAWIFTPSDFGTYAHELGHNLGLYHAGSIWWCDNKSVGDFFNKPCGMLIEYGDPYDVMGMAKLHHINAPHKWSLGWLNRDSIPTISRPGRYTIYALEKKINSPQAIKIPKQDTADQYFLEYRQPIGFDSTLPSNITSGVSVRMWYGYRGLTALLDMNPNPNRPSTVQDLKNYFQDAALKDGQTYNDPINGISIKQISHDADKAEVEINFTASQIQPWRVEPYLPEPVTLHGTTQANGYLISAGGSNPYPSFSVSNDVYSAKVGNDGALGSWQLAGKLPKPLVLPILSSFKNYVYVMGGDTNESVPNLSIYSAKLNDNGILDPWKTVTPLQIPLVYSAVSVSEGYIFISGGINQPAVYSAKLNDDGTISSWLKVANTPRDFSAHAQVIHNGFLYIMGGGGIDEESKYIYEDSVYRAKIIEGGKLEPWIKQPKLAIGVDTPSAHVIDDSLVVLGGFGFWDDGSRGSQDKIQTAHIKADGSLDPWVVHSFGLPHPLSSTPTVIINNYLYVVGGTTDFVPLPTVYSLPLNDFSQVCLQVITSARNNLTKECKMFPNSCLEPGWEKDDSCETFTLSGKVVDQNGQGVANITVNPAEHASSCRVGSAKTDVNGHFQFNNISKGQLFCLRVQAPFGFSGPDLSYECQSAAEAKGTVKCGDDTTLDQPTDNQYNFILTRNDPSLNPIISIGFGDQGMEIPSDGSFVSFKLPLPENQAGETIVSVQVKKPQDPLNKYPLKFIYNPKSSDPTLRTPAGLKYSCLGQGNKASLSWSVLPEQKDNPFYFLLRFNHSPTTIWNPSDPTSGDISRNIGKQLSFEVNIEPNAENNFSLQTVPVGKVSGGQGNLYYDSGLSRSEDLTFSCPASTQTSPPFPTDLISSCLGNNQVKLSWKDIPGISKYVIRIDDTSSIWGGYKIEPGDTLNDNLTQNSYIATTQPTHQYNWWVHSMDGDKISVETHGTIFSCPN